MMIATRLKQHALAHVVLLLLAGDVLARRHGHDPANEDVSGRGHGEEEQDEEERVHGRLSRRPRRRNQAGSLPASSSAASAGPSTPASRIAASVGARSRLARRRPSSCVTSGWWR